jgi:diguanylate cyclase
LDKKDIHKIVDDIKLKAVQSMSDSNTPAYPKYYEQTFKDIVSAMPNEELRNLFKKVTDLSPSEAEKDLEKYIDITKETFEKFSESNKEISKVIVGQGEYIDKLSVAHKDGGVDYDKIVSGMVSFQGQLLDEIRKSDEHIRKLEMELNVALNESMIDRLTKLKNKRAYISDMSKFIATHLQTTGEKILYIDIDNFKALNDKFGYLAGDKVLVFVANTLKSYIGDEERIYRVGDEDFAVVIGNMQRPKVEELADRIRSKVSVSKLVYAEEVIQLTVSIGIVEHKEGEDLIAINSKAQKALEKAKELGKNRVVFLD